MRNLVFIYLCDKDLKHNKLGINACISLPLYVQGKSLYLNYSKIVIGKQHSLFFSKSILHFLYQLQTHVGVVCYMSNLYTQGLAY